MTPPAVHPRRFGGRWQQPMSCALMRSGLPPIALTGE
jgi:hypothetical protein